MTRSSSLPLRLAALLGSAAIIAAPVAARRRRPAPPSSQRPASGAPGERSPVRGAMVYPADAEAPCGTDALHRATSSRSRPSTGDRRVRAVHSRPAFLPKIAFSVVRHPRRRLPRGACGRQVAARPAERHRSVQARPWDKGNRLVLAAVRRLLGRQGHDTERRVPLERRGRPAAARAAVRQRRRHRQPRRRRHPDDPGRQRLQFNPREGMNTLYFGFNNTFAPWDNENVRQALAMGIDRQQLVDNFYPEGSNVANALHAVLDPVRLRGRRDLGLRCRAGQAAPGRRRVRLRVLPRSSSEPLSAATCRTRPSSRPRSSSSSRSNLGITATLDLQESGAFLDANAAGTLDGILLLGWGADYPDPTNFLDYHFGSGAGKKFGTPFPDIVGRAQPGATSLDDAEPDRGLRRGEQPDQAACPAVIVAHGLRHGLQGRRRGRPLPRRSGPRSSRR